MSIINFVAGTIHPENISERELEEIIKCLLIADHARNLGNKSREPITTLIKSE